MPDFEVVGKGTKTGRKRTRRYTAATEAQARALAEQDDTTVESIRELPPAPPSERAMAYARELGVRVPEGATAAELSDLIAVKTEDDEPSNARDRAVAATLGVDVTAYIGEESLFAVTQDTVKRRNQRREQIAWFTYCVTRDLAQQGAISQPSTLQDPMIQRAVDALEGNDTVLRSIRRLDLGSELRRFGEHEIEPGVYRQFGSRGTAAYKAVRQQLIGEQGPPEDDSPASGAQPQRPEGRHIRTEVRATLKREGPSLWLWVGIGAVLLFLMLVGA